MNEENYLENNRVFLTGTVTEDPAFSHELYGEGFYCFKVEVPRLSEQTDVIPVTVSERLMPLVQDSVIYDTVTGSDHCPVGLQLREIP